MKLKGRIKEEPVRKGSSSFLAECLVEDVINMRGSPVGKVSVVLSKRPLIVPGDYLFEGYWEEDKFFAESFADVVPKTRAELIKYLSDMDGITVATARKIYREFGLQALDNLDCDLNLLLIRGIVRSAQLKKIAKAWAKRRSSRELFEYLNEHGVSDKAAMSLYERFGNYSFKVISQSPYKLMEIPGFSFYIADKLALEHGVSVSSEERIRAAVLSMLSENESGGETFQRLTLPTGSTCLNWKGMLKTVRAALGTEVLAEKIGKAVLDLEKENLVYVDSDEDFFLPATAKQELSIANNICRLLRSDIKKIATAEEIGAMNEEFLTRVGIAGKLSKEQIKAIETALNNSVSVITGGPGTGKTMIEKAMIHIVRKKIPNAKVICIAPTGRAASRMTEATGNSAQTAHSLLKIYAEENSCEKGVEIKADLVLVDEFSMCDTFLASKLFEAIKTGTRIVLIGDEQQLPSVGAGCVLKEILSSKVVPTAILTKVFRQKGDSLININATRIKEGKVDFERDKSFQFVNVPEESIDEKVVEIFKKKSDELGIENVCVLSPYRRVTSTGTNRLNDKLEKALVPNKDSRALFAKGDRVMYIRNKNGLSNGDVGTVIEYTFSPEKMAVKVRFDYGKIVELVNEQIEDLVLAFAITVHKSQGSEYQCVILVSDERHKKLQNKAVWYTALTRAKKQVIIVGKPQAFIDTCTIQDTALRRSCLSKFLQETWRKQTEQV